jgi:hypothetical protein
MKMISKIQQYNTAIIGSLVTIALTLLSDFILKLPSEITWLTFFLGSIVTISVTILEQKILSATSEELNRKLEIYNLLEKIDDDEFRQLADVAIEECIKKLREYSQGYTSFATHGYLTNQMNRCKKSYSATFWAPTTEEIYKLEDENAGANYSKANFEATKLSVFLCFIKATC